eukprot:764898-Hanusia_phi.AAC.1
MSNHAIHADLNLQRLRTQPVPRKSMKKSRERGVKRQKVQTTLSQQALGNDCDTEKGFKVITDHSGNSFSGSFQSMNFPRRFETRYLEASPFLDWTAANGPVPLIPQPFMFTIVPQYNGALPVMADRSLLHSISLPYMFYSSAAQPFGTWNMQEAGAPMVQIKSLQCTSRGRSGLNIGIRSTRTQVPQHSANSRKMGDIHLPQWLTPHWVGLVNGWAWSWMSPSPIRTTPQEQLSAFRPCRRQHNRRSPSIA